MKIVDFIKDQYTDEPKRTIVVGVIAVLLVAILIYNLFV